MQELNEIDQRLKQPQEETLKKMNTMTTSNSDNFARQVTMKPEKEVVPAYKMPTDIKSKEKVNIRKIRRKAFRALMLNEETQVQEGEPPSPFFK